MKKITTVMLALTLMFTQMAFVGCGAKIQKEDPIDVTKTQLYVGVYQGGLGTDWLNSVIADFVEAYKDVSFEEGKMGVQIYLDAKKAQYEYATLRSSLQSNSERAEVYFTDNIIYNELIQLGLLEDITDVVTKKTEKSKDSAVNDISIEDKMKPIFKDYYKVSDKYYAIPFNDSLTGIVYDHDLLASEDLLSYGDGPDGRPATDDDGLPSTIGEFYEMLTAMIQVGIIPFTWTGVHTFYHDFLLNGITAQYEGENDWNLNYSYSGTDSQFGEITPATGYKLAAQEGKLKALEVAKNIINNPSNFSSAAWGASQSHTQAQEEFVASVLTNKRIAMLIEGAWWEKEAKGTFDAMSKDPDFGYGKRDLRMMPFPAIDGQAMDGSAYYSFTGKTAVFARKGVNNLNLAKEFIKFSTSEKALRTFTLESGSIRPYEYTMEDKDLAKMTKFTQDLWKQYRSDKVHVVYDLPKSKIREFSSYVQNYKTVINKATYNQPLKDFYGNTSLTAKTYFDGISKLYSAEDWNKELSDFFD